LKDYTQKVDDLYLLAHPKSESVDGQDSMMGTNPQATNMTFPQGAMLTNPSYVTIGPTGIPMMPQSPLITGSQVVNRSPMVQGPNAVIQNQTPTNPQIGLPGQRGFGYY